MNSLNLLFFYSSHIGHSFTNSSCCHDVERISCKFTESWILQSVFSPPLANSASPSCHKLSVALTFLRMPISNALDHYSVTRTKNSYCAPDTLRTKLNPHPPHTRMHMTAGSREGSSAPSRALVHQWTRHISSNFFLGWASVSGKPHHFALKKYLLIPGDQIKKLRDVMMAWLLHGYKHLCTLINPFVGYPVINLKTFIWIIQQAVITHISIGPQACEECFIVHFAFQ